MTARSRATIRIEAQSRWDALDLVRNLPTWSWYLVSQGAERWEICVRADARRRTSTERLLDAVQAWADRREIDAIVHLEGGDVAVHHVQPAAH